jgi:hypothetical protein
VAAVGELREEYGDQVDFEVISPEETSAAGEDLARYNLASRGHGLVAITAGGEAVVTIAGHQFGRDEIVMAIEQVVEP